MAMPVRTHARSVRSEAKNTRGSDCMGGEGVVCRRTRVVACGADEKDCRSALAQYGDGDVSLLAYPAIRRRMARVGKRRGFAGILDQETGRGARRCRAYCLPR